MVKPFFGEKLGFLVHCVSCVGAGFPRQPLLGFLTGDSEPEDSARPLSGRAPPDGPGLRLRLPCRQRRAEKPAEARAVRRSLA